jgi:hypothetical protein
VKDKKKTNNNQKNMRIKVDIKIKLNKILIDEIEKKNSKQNI